jgi:GMP synthase (glutamine-hydrolysing)
MSHDVLILCHAANESGGTIETALSRAGLPYRYINLYREVPSQLPLEQATGLVVLGGPMNVDEVQRYPFLAADVRWIRQAVEGRLPVLGVCLGAQLLAKALGARVYANGVKEIGWYPIEMTPAAADDALFACGGTQTVFQWHGDTFDLPAEAVQLARSPLCEYQAFRYGPTAYGLQFHVEMTAPMIDQWLAAADASGELDGLDYIDAGKIRGQSPQELPQLQALAAQMLGRFAAMCQKTASGGCVT